jgi:hypothetical protein
MVVKRRDARPEAPPDFRQSLPASSGFDMFLGHSRLNEPEAWLGE